jgi:hypothetical protein
MLNSVIVRRAGAAAVVAVCALLLAACLVLPGKFAATLDLRKDGHFTYTYKGDIVILGVTKLAEMAMAQKPKPVFAPSACYKEDGEAERDCTPAEVTAQKKDWQAQQTVQAEKDARDKAMIVKALGGIDPTDPKAAAEIAARLSGQAGFKRVTYMGNGRYDVDYAISGMLTYDYQFPTIERMMPQVIPFIVLNKRNNGEVRIDSPLMQQAALSMPGGNMTQVFAQMIGMDKDGKRSEATRDFPVVDGHFTLITDGVVLSNNTEHGAKTVPGGKQLDWDINFMTAISPMALIELTH